VKFKKNGENHQMPGFIFLSDKPDIQVPGFQLLREYWITLNRVKIGQWKYDYALYK
jgi:hypothetical protein